MPTGDPRTVLVTFGTRPEAIKMCPLVTELRSRAAFRTVVCVTGQHRSMLDQVLRAFDVVPDYDLSIMRPGQDLFDITTNVLDGFRAVVDEVQPDVCLVHGDTTTAFAAALACFYLQVPVGHVEAGLRTYDLANPYPEEFNRQAVDSVSSLCFAPTGLAREHLVREGKPDDSVFVTGNTVIDALKTTVRAEYSHPELDWAAGSRLLLITAHRRENLGDPMRAMFRAIRRVVEETPDVKAIYPVHLNPAVQAAAAAELGDCSRVRLIEPLDALDFHNFMARSHLILTDSGGIQEEAPSLAKPVLVMRSTTERPEGLEAGTLKLVGTDEQTIYTNLRLLLDDETAYQQMARAANPYGDGQASQRIADVLETATLRGQ